MPLSENASMTLEGGYLTSRRDCISQTKITVFSLTKDMTGKEDMYRSSAIRALCKITDVCNVLHYELKY